MIVGLSLVHLATIESRATDLGVWLTREITANQTTLNGTAGIVLALAFGFSGFLLVYLWSLRFLPSELRQSYSALSEKIDQANSKTDALLVRFSEFKNMPIFSIPEHALNRQEARMKAVGVDDLTCTEVRTRYGKASKGSDEPMENFGREESNGYKLSVTVEDQGMGIFSFTAKITPPAGTATGTVFWLLHNSFTPDVVSECPIEAEGATFNNTANEAFWLGAVVPQTGREAIRLAFDLRNAKGATDAFKNGTLPM